MERQALEALGRDPNCYGILRPRGDARLSLKSVSQETALLLLTLQTPGALPQFARRALGERCDSVIGRMVLDGILEIEVNGTMLSGPEASAFIYGEPFSPGPQTRLGTLSRNALAYAQALKLTDRAALSARLYAYNCIPVSARWRRLLTHRRAVEAYLGVDDSSVALASSWIRLPTQAPAQGWMAWQSLRAKLPAETSLTYKLYVSPVCDDVRAAFQATAEVVSQSAAFHWKAGSDLYGLLRPDKIVIYFRELADLQTAAAHLLEELDGCSPQGVPFTAEFGGRGLLSWGIDPPADKHTVPWLVRESWRSRICNRLAAALAMAETSDRHKESAARFAVERLALDGIDTETWTPTSAFDWGGSDGT
ncbi:MAG: hypothetical protein JO104_06160 [Candidatus Eremiobacteraeota bacterium]|nr:hypothetical protein [Candidatus Eremiobacteraeota bacterium]